MLQVLDAAAVRRWCAAGARDLAAAQVEIDDLNVYPVPDGDTGTNLMLTMQAVEQAVQAAPDDLDATLTAMARGGLMGARGNSGVILAQLLRGMAEVLRDGDCCTAAQVQQALTRAAQLCYAAVATPVEGTLLTVARESAEAAAALGAVDLASVVREAHAGAKRSLARTPELLPALRAAGVVDAGGRGLCVLLGALERVVTGAGDTVPGAGDTVPGAGSTAPELLVPRDRTRLIAARETGSDAYAYEVQYLLEGATDVLALTAALSALGDSLVIVGGDGLHNVHVHVDDVGAAIEAGVEAGRPFRITVTRFADQLEAAATPPRHAPGRRVVAIALGAGLAALFEQAGALVVDGGPAARPSTGELLEALRRAGTGEVVLLPNDADSLGTASAAAAAARDEGFSVAVLPTRSVVQGLAALAVCDAERPFADDVASMAEAAGSTRWAEVTVAAREAATMAGVCRPGDVLGLIEGDVALIGDDLERAALELVHRMLAGGGELVTVVTGADAPAGSGERLVEAVEHAHHAVEVVLYAGGQPHHPFLLGVE